MKTIERLSKSPRLLGQPRKISTLSIYITISAANKYDQPEEGTFAKRRLVNAVTGEYDTPLHIAAQGKFILLSSSLHSFYVISSTFFMGVNIELGFSPSRRLPQNITTFLKGCFYRFYREKK